MENSGCVVMMKEQKLDDLRRMYMLFSRVPATLELVRDCMNQYVRRLGAEVVAEQDTTKDPVMFVQNLLDRSEEHTSELQSLMRISYAVFCLKKKKYTNTIK